MSDLDIRPGKKRFFDNKKFPRGFAKSGDFTLTEEDLLSTYGETLLGLETGTLQPESEGETHFMSILAEPDSAANKLEKAWLKYVRIARGRKRFHTLNGRNKPDASDDFLDEEPGLSDDD